MSADARLLITLNSIGDAVISTNADDIPKIEYLNPVAENLTGWTLGEAKGQAVHEVFNIINQHTRKPAENPIYKVINEGKTVGLANHTILISKDKTEYIIEDSAAPIRDKDGDLVGVVLVFRDVTAQRHTERERLEAQKQIEVERQKLTRFFEQAPVPLAIVEGPDHRFTFVNQTYNSLFFNGREVVGKTVIEIAPESVEQGYLGFLNQVYQSGETYHGKEIPLTLKQLEGGEKKYVLNFVYQPTRNAKNEVDGIIVIAIDVTDQTQAREAIENQQKWLESILDRMPTALFAIDPTLNKVNFSNKAALAMLGVQTNNSLPGERYSEKIRIYDQNGRLLPESEIPSARASRGEEMKDEQMRIETPAGEFHLSVASEMVPASYGHDKTALLVLQDVSAIKSAEEQFKLFTELAPQMPFIADATGNITYFSKQWYQYIGNVEGTEGWGWKDRDIQHPEDLPGTVQAWKKALATGEPYEAAYRLRRHDGVYRWHLGRASAVKDAHGKVVKWFGTNVDIHEQKILSQRILASESQFRFLANAMPQIIWTARADGVLNYTNQKWTDYSGSSDPEKWLSFVHPDDRPEVVKNWTECVQTGKPYEAEFRLKHFADGTYRWHLVRALRAIDESINTETYWYGTCTDVTEHKRLQAEIQEAKNRAVSASETKSAFLANMSHEIRTPLGAILGFTELLRTTPLSEEARGFLDVVSRSGQNLTRVIDDILDLSKVEAGQLNVELIPFSLNELVQDTVALFADQAAGKNILLKVHLLPKSPGLIISDPTRIRQILINLIGNAVKFTAQGEVTISLASRSVQNDTLALSIEVKDTGIGLSQDQSEKLFQPFVQADESTTRKHGGTGLGLALSKRLALILGGDISLKNSALGLGCTFVFDFNATSTTGKKATLSPEVKKSDKPKRLDGVQMLVVDDSPDNRTLVSLFLKREGAHIDQAASGEDALKKVSATNYDVVLMDIQMPGMDGYNTLAAVKKLGFKNPVIALTAHAMIEERQRTMAAGFVDHVTKPIEREILVSAILNQLKSKSIN